MIKINESNFEQETNQGLVLVKFTATWCGPCRLLTPVLEQIEGCKLLEVDVDESQDLARKHNIQSIPHVIILKDGVQVDTFVGLRTKDDIQNKVNALKG